MKKNLKQANPEETVNNAAQDSQTQPSAKEQKNHPQSNTIAEENKPVLQQFKNSTSELSSERIDLSASEIITQDKENLMKWIENPKLGPNQLKGAVDLFDSAIELREEVLLEETSKSKRIPGVDRRIQTLVLFDNQIETGDRYLSDINKIKLQTELTNLREKRFLVWQKFVKIVGSEKKILKYEGLRAKAKSKLYHSKSSYFIKQRIGKIFNSVIKNDKSTLIEVKTLAEDTTDVGVKLFNEKMRDLLYEYDEENVVLFLHVNRDLYFNIMRLTLVKWDPDTDLEITELTEPNE